MEEEASMCRDNRYTKNTTYILLLPVFVSIPLSMSYSVWRDISVSVLQLHLQAWRMYYNVGR